MNTKRLLTVCVVVGYFCVTFSTAASRLDLYREDNSAEKLAKDIKEESRMRVVSSKY